MSVVTGSMRIDQRATAILRICSEIAKLLLSISLILLPVAAWPSGKIDRVQSASKTDHHQQSPIFLFAFIVDKLNRYLLFGRVGTKAVAIGIRKWIWSAPCKNPSQSTSFHLRHPLFHNTSHLQRQDIAYRTLFSSVPGEKTFNF